MDDKEEGPAMTIDEKFHALIRRAIGEADDIDCSPDDYIDSLRAWKDEIDIAIQAMRESL